MLKTSVPKPPLSDAPGSLSNGQRIRVSLREQLLVTVGFGPPPRRFHWTMIFCQPSQDIPSEFGYELCCAKQPWHVIVSLIHFLEVDEQLFWGFFGMLVRQLPLLELRFRLATTNLGVLAKLRCNDRACGQDAWISQKASMH